MQDGERTLPNWHALGHPVAPFDLAHFLPCFLDQLAEPMISVSVSLVQLWRAQTCGDAGEYNQEKKKKERRTVLMQIKPLADRVVVKPLEETEQMRGGL